MTRRSNSNNKNITFIRIADNNLCRWGNRFCVCSLWFGCWRHFWRLRCRGFFILLNRACRIIERREFVEDGVRFAGQHPRATFRRRRFFCFRCRRPRWLCLFLICVCFFVLGSAPAGLFVERLRPIGLVVYRRRIVGFGIGLC